MSRVFLKIIHMKTYFKIGLFLFFLTGIISLTKTNASENKGTLYGNSAGTRYCCAEGNNGCGAAPCSSIAVE